MEGLNLKKLITLAVASALVATVAGCGNKAQTPATTPAASTGAAGTTSTRLTVQRLALSSIKRKQLMYRLSS
jgi:uncharacterized lipoprotein YehR (DUF1307 family)